MTDQSLQFSYNTTKNGAVHIMRAGKLVTILGDHEASRFLNRIASKNEAQSQIEMARVTGQYKFGNEHLSRNKRKR